MKELDVLLLTYLERFFASADGVELQAFAELLDLQDPELYQLLLGGAVTGSQELDSVIGKIRNALEA